MRQLLAIALALALAGLAGAARAAEPLVDAAWIKANLGTPGVVFLDVRGPLGGASKAQYLLAHIPGAIYSDYLKDGWRIKDKNGTVGMLPPAGRLEQLIGGLNDDDWQRDTTQPWGTPVKLGQGLIDMPLKCLSAYRMQLFLHAKASCDVELDSANCWMGTVMPRAM